MRIHIALSLILSLAACVVFPLPAWAEKASRAEAEQVCRNWLTYMIFERGEWARETEPQIRDVEPIVVEETLVGWHFAIDPQGFIVVPVLKELPAIKTYSETCNLDITEEDGFPRLVRDALHSRTRLFVETYGTLDASQPPIGEVLFGRAHREEWDFYLAPSEEFAGGLRAGPSHNPLLGSVPLLRSNWHGKSPYYSNCPQGIGNDTCRVGPAATATAQIMRYHEWPQFGENSKDYYWDGDNSCLGIPPTPGGGLSADFDDPYEWDKMLDDYDSGYTEDQRDAVAELCYEVGVAFGTDYGFCRSVATCSTATTALPTYFRYSENIGVVHRKDCTADLWFGNIIHEITGGRPVLYSIEWYAGKRHAMVCDGWRTAGATNQYHINYGLGGSYTAWYAIDEIYQTLWIDREYIVVGIQPKRTFLVHPDGPPYGDFTTIQEAIDAASDGDVIELADITHSGPGNYDIDYRGKSVLIRSAYGWPSLCIIDPGSAGRGFIFQSGEDRRAVLRRVTIMDARSDVSGGGILCMNSSSPTIRECVIKECHAGWQGGGMFCSHSGPRVLSCTFQENTCGSFGGGISYSDSCSVELVDCLMENNTAYDGGGGVWCYDWEEPHELLGVQIERCVFLDNTATTGYGGGLLYHRYRPTLSFCTFARNSAALDGGAIVCGDGSPELIHCTLHANSAGANGGGLCLGGNTAGTIDNTIISSSTSGEAIYCWGDSTPTLTHCDLWDNAGGDWTPPINGQQVLRGNFSLDPMYCPRGNNFKLSVYSPCAPVDSIGRSFVGAWPVGCGIMVGPGDLDQGVLIAHAAGVGCGLGGECGRYADEFGIEDCGFLNDWLRFGGGGPRDDDTGLWYVVAAWNDEKQWQVVEFGLGDYADSNLVIVDHGPCFPVGHGTEIGTEGWPGPNSGVTLTAEPGYYWDGNYVPLYYFQVRDESMGTDQTVMPLTVHPETGTAKVVNLDGEEFDLVGFGGMGINTDGFPACPGSEGPFVCCLPDGGCRLLEEATCGDQGGTWHALWDSCDPNPCPPIEAVCCFDADCVLLSEEACLADEGEWYPGQDNCDPNPCPDPSDVPISEEPPKMTQLRASMPNPFARNAVIHFDLAQPGDVALAVYDLGGRLVRRLVDGHHAAMRYSLHWDGRDQRGIPVPGGVYFLRLNTDHVQQSRRLIRIR